MKIVTIIGILVVLAGCTQVPPIEELNKMATDIDPKIVVTEENYPDGKVHKIIRSQKGYEIDTTTFSYQDNGNIKWKKRYVNSVLHGISTKYYPNGKVYGEFRYADGLRQGVSTTYYPDGKVWWKLNYVDDVQHGISTFYDPDGNVYGEYRFADGVQL